MQSLANGESPVLTVRVPGELMKELDRWRAETGESRSAFIRNALAVLINELESGGVQ